MAIIKTTRKNNPGWEYKLVEPLWKTVWRFLKKLKIEMPSNSTSGYLSKNYYIKDIWTPMFFEALFTIAKTQKQFKSLSTDKWIKKLCYTHSHTHNRVLFSHKKGNPAIQSCYYKSMDGSLSHNTKWNKPEKGKYYMISLICKIYKKPNS